MQERSGPSSCNSKTNRSENMPTPEVHKNSGAGKSWCHGHAVHLSISFRGVGQGRVVSHKSEFRRFAGVLIPDGAPKVNV